MAYKSIKHISALTVHFGPDGSFVRAMATETERMMDGENVWGEKSSMPRELTEEEMKALLGEQVAGFTAAVDKAKADCVAAEARAKDAEAKVAKLEARIARVASDV